MWESSKAFGRWSAARFLYEEPADGGAGAGAGAGGADDPVKKLAFERDSARAAESKLRRELDEIKRSLPTDEQRARWDALEKANETREEEQKRKAGEFDALRVQITEKSARELEAERKRTADESAKAQKVEQELQDTLIGLSFAGASDLFSPTGKTVLLPQVAQAYFRQHVAVVTDETSGRRTVVVKDAHGTVLVDPKTGQPLPFARAMQELIESHPDKAHLLRGSGKVGSGSAGGADGVSSLDLRNLTPDQLRDPKVLAAIKAAMPKNAVVMGEAFER